MPKHRRKAVLVKEIQKLLSEVEPEALRLADLWYIKRVLEVANAKSLRGCESN